MLLHSNKKIKNKIWPDAIISTNIYKQIDNKINPNINRDNSVCDKRKKYEYCILKYFNSKFPTLLKIIDEEDIKNENKNDYTKKTTNICYAPAQSGKTNFIIWSSILSIFRKNILPVVIVRNINADACQLHSRYINTILKINEHLIGISIKKKININIIKSIDLSDYKICRILKYALKSLYIKKKVPTVVICLANPSQTSKLYKILKKYPSMYEVYIDEIDNICYSDSVTAKNIDFIKEKSNRNVGITATPLDSIFTEPELKSSNIIILPISEKYYGIDKLSLHTLIYNVYSININSNYNEMLEKDKNIKPFFDTFKELKVEDIPNICLVKFTRLIINQEHLYDGLIENYNKDFTIIIHNANGIKIYHHKLIDFIIKGKNVSCNKYYTDVQINDTLQFLYDNGGLSIFPKIIIIAGDIASRSVSFSSTNYKWHLTDMYYIPARNTPTNELEQHVCRLAGVYMDGAPRLFLHTTSYVAEAVWKSHNLIKEVVSRGIENPLFDENGKELCFRETINKIEINKEKIPSGRNFTSKSSNSTKKMFNKVEGIDGGWDINRYKIAFEQKNNLQDIGENVDINDIGLEEYKRLFKIFIKWSSATTKISLFMKNLEPDKIYTSSEFRKFCKTYGILDIGKIMNEQRGNSNGFGKLIKKNENNTYQLYPCLIPIYKQIFIN